MTTVEMFVIFGAGYVSGLSIASGFLFQAIRKFNQDAWSKAKEVAWVATAMINIVLGALMPIFLIGLVVVGDQPGRQDFWPRAWLFAFGLVAGGALVFFGFSQINKGVRTLLGKSA